mmetsp:Transcript_24193/g.76052  ORF Transcript_24193/g.76052 Transcript_24193/m.76052 type:complete len:1791 (-) Transcript_24193:597-5969(-)
MKCAGAQGSRCGTGEEEVPVARPIVASAPIPLPAEMAAEVELKYESVANVFEETFAHLYPPEPELPPPEEGEGEGGEAGGDARDAAADGKGAPAAAAPAEGDKDAEGAEGEEAKPPTPPPPDPYEERIATIDEKCVDRVTNMDDTEAYLKETYKKQEEDEEAALLKADDDFTANWRKTGVPIETITPSLLALDPDDMHTKKLVLTADLMVTNRDSRIQLQAPPKTLEFLDTSMPHYLEKTNNLRVREEDLAGSRRKHTKEFRDLDGKILTVEEVMARAAAAEERVKVLRNTMNKDQWDLEKKVIQNMQMKLNFLRNPRYAKQPKLGRIPGGQKVTSPEEVLFAVEPKEICFANYEVGGLYEMLVDLRNVSVHTRRLRLLPPTTQYFSISQLRFPNVDGQIAPGMAASAIIRFCPDSLADYDDYFQVQTELNKFQVHIKARRPPPSITIPQTLDAGFCLVGNTCRVEFECNNVGGPGRFRLVPVEDWPDRIPVEVPERLSIPPFTVEPAEFHLMGGDSVTVAITFSPPDTGNHVATFRMACDNCQVKDFTLAGVGCVVEVGAEAVDRRPISEAERGAPVWFDAAVPGDTTTRVLRVRNSTPLPMPYEWVQMLPAATPRPDLADLPLAATTPKDYFGPPRLLGVHPEEQGAAPVPPGPAEGVFTVEPRTGTIPAKSEQEFRVTFAPTEIAKFQRLLQLLVDTAVPGTEGSRPDHLIEEVRVEGLGCSCDVELVPAMLDFAGELLVGKEYVRDISLTNRSGAAIEYSIEGAGGAVSVSPGEGRVEPGESVIVDVTLHAREVGREEATLVCAIKHGPRLPIVLAADISGPLVVIEQTIVDFGLVSTGTEREVDLTVVNTSAVPAGFRAREQGDASGGQVSFTAPDGFLPPAGRAIIKVRLAAATAGALRTRIALDVEGGRRLFVACRADIVTPRACLSESIIDLGQSFTLVNVEKTVTMRNLTQLPCEYAWDSRLLGRHEAVRIAISPAVGTIAPGGEEEFQVTITPLKAGFCEVLAACDVVGMAGAIGFLLKSDIQGLIFSYDVRAAVDEASPAPSRVANALPGGGFGDTAKMTTYQKPAAALASAKSGAAVPPRLMGVVKRHGMDEDVVIDFGRECEIGTRISLELVVRNESPIQCPVSISLDDLEAPEFWPDSAVTPRRHATPRSFLARSLTRRATASSMAGSRGRSGKGGSVVATAKKSITLSEGHEGARPFRSEMGQATVAKRNHDKEDRDYLRDGRGVALRLIADDGPLEPWGEWRCEIVCYSNMAGDYLDMLHVKVGQKEVKNIPVRVGVVGSPLVAQKDRRVPPGLPDSPVPWQKAPKLELQYGAMVAGSPEVSKSFHVVNQGPFPMRLDWTVMNYARDETLGDREHVADGVTVVMDGEHVRFLAAPHGEPGDEYFRVEPAGAVIAPGGQARFTASFFADHAEWYAGHLRGVQTVISPECEQVVQTWDDRGEGGEPRKELVVRGSFHPYASKPAAPLPDLRVGLAAKCLACRLEPDGLGEVEWAVHSPDDPLTHDSYLHTVCLSNTSKAALSFFLEASKPFSVVEVEPSLDQPPRALLDLPPTAAGEEAGEAFLLPPRENVSVTLRFTPPKVESPDRKDFEMKGTLWVCYSNGERQPLPLVARVLHPEVTVGPASLSFGLTHTQAPRRLKVTLTNPTLVDAAWSAADVLLDADPSSQAESARARKSARQGQSARSTGRRGKKDKTVAFPEKKMFTVVPSSGTLPGKGTGHPRTQVVEVVFDPQDPTPYKSTLALAVHAGRGVELKAEGEGTHVESYEDDLGGPIEV